MPHIFFMLHYTIFCVFSQVKKTIQEHKGNLEAAEAACAELVVEEEILPSTSSKPKKRQLDSDTEILQSLQKRVEESSNVFRDITKAQQQSISSRSAFANYVRDSILTMSKTKFKKARSSINHSLSELMEYSDDEMPTTTAQAAPVPTTQQPVFSQRHAVRPSSAPTLASFGSYDQQQPRFWGTSSAWG